MPFHWPLTLQFLIFSENCRVFSEYLEYPDATPLVLAHSGFVIRCCSMADSQLILELLFLRTRGGCSLNGNTFLPDAREDVFSSVC